LDLMSIIMFSLFDVPDFSYDALVKAGSSAQ